MNRITLPRAVVEQALEALTAHADLLGTMYLRMDAITALKAALAQQAEPVEPNRWEGDHDIESPNNACMHKGYCMSLKQAREPMAQQAELVLQGPVRIKPGSYTLGATWVGGGGGSGGVGAPPQQAEPVAPAFHGFMSADGTRVDVCFTPNAPRSDGAYATAYYTAPPQRKPLTSDEIQTLWSPYRGAAPFSFARAVERAHGITDPKVEDRLARHGIPMPEAPACPDCHGIGYDASGQICACQENPSF